LLPLAARSLVPPRAGSALGLLRALFTLVAVKPVGMLGTLRSLRAGLALLALGVLSGSPSAPLIRT
jgi:hypothetical protein